MHLESCADVSSSVFNRTFFCGKKPHYFRCLPMLDHVSYVVLMYHGTSFFSAKRLFSIIYRWFISGICPVGICGYARKYHNFFFGMCCGLIARLFIARLFIRQLGARLLSFISLSGPESHGTKLLRCVEEFLRRFNTQSH